MMFVDSSVKGGWGWKGTESKLTCHVSPCSLHLVHVDVDLYQHQGHYYFLISGVTLAIPPLVLFEASCALLFCFAINSVPSVRGMRLLFLRYRFVHVITLTGPG